MFLRFIAVVGLAGAVSAAAAAQTSRESQPKLSLDSDIRIFAVSAALNVASSADGGKFGTDLDPDLVGRLKQFYSAHKGNRSVESQFPQYIGLAVSLSEPPELKPLLREERLPDDTRALLSFVPLLKEFCAKARIEQRWSLVHPVYEAELKQLQPKVSAAFLQTDAYLRTTLAGSGPRRMHIEAELLAPLNSVNMRVYENDYYVVIGPSSTTNLDDVRHAYLHFHLDDIVNRNVVRIANKDRILALIDGEQGVDVTYTKEFGVMTTESLIRAIELRMDRSTASRAKDVVANAYRSGLLLTPYFYDALPSFQNGSESFRDAFAGLAEGIGFQTELDRFQSTFHSIPLPQRSRPGGEGLEAAADLSPAPVQRDPVRELIVEAQTAYNNMDNDGAQALFLKVIREHDPNNGAALYGLGLLASRAADIEQSQLYFERAVKSSSADASMKVWSYIYLGHIADLQCQRGRASEYYRQAIQIGDNTRDAQTSATSGLSKAFGDQCR